MASFDILHVEGNNSSGSFPSDDYSFLPEVSVHPRSENEVENHMNGDLVMTNMQSYFLSAGPNIIENIQERLSDLLKENNLLKDDLNRNNELMRDQLTTIEDWRQKMLHSKEQQQGILEKGKEEIRLLKEGKAAVEEKLDFLTKEYEKLINQPTCENCKSFEATVKTLQETNQSAENLNNELIRKLQEKRNLQKHLRDYLAAMNLHLNNVLLDHKTPKKTKLDLKIVNESLMAAVDALMKSCDSVATVEEDKDYVVVTENHLLADSLDYLDKSSEIEELKKELEEKVKELEKSREREQEMSLKMESYMNEMQSMEKQFESRCEMGNSPESSLAMRYKERSERLQHQLIEALDKLEKCKNSNLDDIAQLTEETKELKEILKLEELSHQKDKDRLADVMLKFEKLQVDHERISALLQIHMKDEKESTLEQSMKEESVAKSHQEKVDHLTAHLFDTQENLKECKEEIARLREKLSSGSKDIECLKTQMNLYKQDLEQAILTRDTAYAEIEKLEKELKKYRKKESDPQARRSSNSNMGDADDKAIIYECCICQRILGNYSALENHVELCLAQQNN